MKKRLSFIICVLLALALALSSCDTFIDYTPPIEDGTEQNGNQNGAEQSGNNQTPSNGTQNSGEENTNQTDGAQSGTEENRTCSLEDIAAFDGKNPYAVVNGNVPYFTNEDVSKSYEL